jgi:DNA-binding GntR family transcriptional regulator
MMTFTNTDAKPTQLGDRGHGDIVAAAVRGDVDEARKLVAQHLDEARQRILPFLQE